MKSFFYLALSVCLLASCQNRSAPIVSQNFVDSLITHYDNSASLTRVEQDLVFWKNRIEPSSPDFVNTLRYAAQLVGRFHLLGHINDVVVSDSVLNKLVTDFNGKEASPYLALVRNAILQHRFRTADSLLHLADSIGIKPYDAAALSFDVDFELGRMTLAENDLKKITMENDYGYQFRQSKLMHYKGELGASLKAMEKAAELCGNNEILRNAALSNLADLYVHAGKLDKAYNTYVQCIKADPADLHSLMGIGRIALLSDKKDSLAQRIFQFIASKTAAPDAIYQLIGVAEERGDSVMMKKWATEFEAKTTMPVYGHMYNKYLIYLYAGILNAPAKGEALALKELQNRNTPQTNAWYAYALMKNGKTTEAYAVYNKSISEKPLEGLELYYMGKLMKALDKGFNANQFFEQAEKNRYDLTTGINKDLDLNKE